MKEQQTNENNTPTLPELYMVLGECDYMYIRCSREMDYLEQRRTEILKQIENLTNGTITDNNHKGMGIVK